MTSSVSSAARVSDFSISRPGFSTLRPQPLPVLRLDNISRTALRSYFVNTWQLQDWLFSAIVDDAAYYTNPDPLRHLLLFYLGHPAVFYINKLFAAGTIQKQLEARYEKIFEIGVDPEKPEDILPRINSISWPSIDDVWEYRAEAFKLVSDLIETIPLDFAENKPSPLWALMMSIEHDRIHFETSSVLFRQLPLKQLRRPLGWTYAEQGQSALSNPMLRVPRGEVILGRPADFPTFGWDNEYGRRVEAVDSFEASKYLVSNRELLEFVSDRGYLDDRLWEPEARQWRSRNHITHPKFWLPRPEGFRYRAMFDEIELPLRWPAEVNFYEAEAFCRWKGESYRLMSEAEWHRITADDDSDSRNRAQNDLCFGSPFNMNMAFGSPVPVDSGPENCYCFAGSYGNLWQWLSDDFAPLPGFAANELYPDFSAPFFGTKHKMLAGGSWATTGAGTSKFYRLWFRKNFYQHAGFRLARN